MNSIHTQTKTLHEPARTLPLARECDVIVCGGGPAGVAAAISSARAGANTLLIETQGCLGGIWTSGLMPWVLDSGNKDGLMCELDAALRRKDRPVTAAPADENAGGTEPPDRSAYDVEAAKHGLEQHCLKSGVRIRLHTRVCAAIRSGSRIVAAITESKSGREAWSAKIFIDATGDGDLAIQAGCGFEYGRPDAPGQSQPMSLNAMLTGVQLEEIRPFVCNFAPARIDPKAALREVLVNAGVDPSYGAPTLFHIYDDLFLLMANHQYGARGFDADDVTHATIEGRDEIHRLVSALQKCGAEWKNTQLVATSAHIGVRESRRIHGRYRLTQKDLVCGSRFEDAVCTVHFPVDIHSTDPGKGKAYGEGGVRAKPYEIPLRALIAKDVDNLMMAGRCISGDFFAHASYRVTGNAVAMGEAAGRTAAAAVRYGRL